TDSHPPVAALTSGQVAEPLILEGDWPNLTVLEVDDTGPPLYAGRPPPPHPLVEQRHVGPLQHIPDTEFSEPERHHQVRGDAHRERHELLDHRLEPLRSLSVPPRDRHQVSGKQGSHRFDTELGIPLVLPGRVMRVHPHTLQSESSDDLFVVLDELRLDTV